MDHHDVCLIWFTAKHQLITVSSEEIILVNHCNIFVYTDVLVNEVHILVRTQYNNWIKITNCFKFNNYSFLHKVHMLSYIIGVGKGSMRD